MSVADTLEFDPGRLHVTGQADTRPPAPDYAGYALYSFAAVGLVVAIIGAGRWAPKARQILSRPCATVIKFSRDRCEALVCAGLAVLAADYLLLSGLTRHSVLYHPHKTGLIAFAGTLTAIAGLYFWMRTRPKI